MEGTLILIAVTWFAFIAIVFSTAYLFGKEAAYNEMLEELRRTYGERK